MRVQTLGGLLLSGLVLAAAMPLVPARAQTPTQNTPGTSDSRIEAIERQIQRVQQENERQIRALQEELQRVRQQMAVQSDQLKQSQDQAKASQEEARQARAAAAQGQAQTAAQTPSKPVVTTTEKGIQIGGVNVMLGGFVEGAGIFRSRNEVSDMSTDYATIPFKNSVLAHENEFRGSARQSRISLLATGDVDATTHLAAYFESDFLSAGVTSNSRESNSYTPRLRQAYGTVDLDESGFHVLAGQAWTMLTTNSKGIEPRSEALPLTIDAQYVPGFNWARQPQARFVEKFSDTVSAGVSFESPQANFPSGAFTAPAGVNINNPGDSAGYLNATTTYSNDIMPDIIAKVAIDPGWGHYELKGLARVFTDRAAGTTHETWGYGGGPAAIMPLIPTYLDFQVSGLVGAGIGRYGTTLLPDAALSSSNSLVAIPTVHGFAGLIGHPRPGTDVYLYGGWEHADRAGAASLAGYGSPTLINTGCDIEGSTLCQADTKDIRQITTGFWQDLFKGGFGRVTVGAQTSYTTRHAFSGVGGAPDTDQWVVMGSFRYYPF